MADFDAKTGFFLRAAALAKRIYALAPSNQRCIELMAKLSEALEQKVDAIAWHHKLIERRTANGDGQGVLQAMNAVQRLSR
jgi:hypothetical protein